MSLSALSTSPAPAGSADHSRLEQVLVATVLSANNFKLAGAVRHQFSFPTAIPRILCLLAGTEPATFLRLAQPLATANHGRRRSAPDGAASWS